MKPTPRYAIYYRVSTDKQDLQSQEVAIAEWLEGLPPERQPRSVVEYRDRGISGTRKDRPALSVLLDDAYARRFDVLVVYRLDRLSRNAAHAIRLVLNLDAAGVGFVSVTQPILSLDSDNPFKQTMLAAFADLAQLERDSIATRVIAGLKAARKRGVRLGRPPAMDAQVRVQVTALRDQGLSVRAIAERCGVSKSTVGRMLAPRSEARADEPPRADLA